MFLCACCIHYTVETRQLQLIPEILKQKLKIRQKLDKLIRENEGCYSFLAGGKKVLSQNIQNPFIKISVKPFLNSSVK